MYLELCGFFFGLRNGFSVELSLDHYILCLCNVILAQCGVAMVPLLGLNSCYYCRL